MSRDAAPAGGPKPAAGAARETPAPAWAGALADLGPFVAVATHPAGAAPRPRWRPFAELVDSPALLDTRVAATRASLDARRPAGVPGVTGRIAASVTHLGLVARVLSPWIAASALGSGRPPFRLEELWWQDVTGGPVPLSVAAEPAARGRPAVEALTGLALDRHGLGPRVAWGNVASAANGAVTVVTQRRPDLAAAVRAVADRVLADPRLDGGDLRSGPGFRRRSCCLVYRVAGTTDAVCGDCVLAT